MLAKNWKKILMLILILACVSNLMYKVINKLSLKKELSYSATYINETDNENN